MSEPIAVGWYGGKYSHVDRLLPLAKGGGGPTESRRLSLPRRNVATSGCYPQLLVFALLPEPLSHRRRGHHDGGNASGFWDGGCASVQPRGSG